MVTWRKIRGFAHFYLKEGLLMKVNPRTAKFVLDLVAAIAVAASGVVAKYYLEEPKDR